MLLVKKQLYCFLIAGTINPNYYSLYINILYHQSDLHPGKMQEIFINTPLALTYTPIF